eukprot:3202485-Pyramimonas_sp.AAC.1
MARSRPRRRLGSPKWFALMFRIVPVGAPPPRPANDPPSCLLLESQPCAVGILSNNNNAGGHLSKGTLASKMPMWPPKAHASASCVRCRASCSRRQQAMTAMK